MDKVRFFLIISIASVLMLVLFYRIFPGRITGFSPGWNNSVEVAGKMKGDISAFVFQEQQEYGHLENISVEFKNVGSLDFGEIIQLNIYYNLNGRLQQIALYYDGQYNLKPGMARAYSIYFLPPTIGTFYIRARVNYDDNLVVETWRAFLITYTFPAPPPILVPVSPPYTGGEAAPPITEEKGTPNLEVEAPNYVEIQQGKSTLFSILVKNTGEVTLTNMKLSISTTNLVGLNINPKQVFKLYLNDTAAFLISIDIPTATPEGSYPFHFDVISDQITESWGIELRVTKAPKPIEEELNMTILNYEYIKYVLQNEINDAAAKNLDVSQAQSSLDKATVQLDLARFYYQQNRYDDAKSSLDKVKSYLDDAAYQLSNAGAIVTLPAFAPWEILLIAIAIGIFFIIFLARRKKKEEEKLKRPALLKGMEEET